MCVEERENMLEEKFEAVRAIIKEHNDVLKPMDGTKHLTIDVDKFINSIKIMGATTEERLKSLSHEDILDCLPTFEGSVKPKILAKVIAQVFRGKEETSRPISNLRAERMTPRELVEAFDPDNSTNVVGKQLAQISKGHPFIVYSSGRIVDVEATLILLQEVKQGYPPRKEYNLKPVYKLGVLPNNYVDENPIYQNRPLRPDGTCCQTGRSWEGVPLEVRQFVYVAVMTGEIEVKIDNAHNVLDMCLISDPLIKLRARYRKSSLKFDELANSPAGLPKLKISLNDNTTAKINDGKKVSWSHSASGYKTNQ